MIAEEVREVPELRGCILNHSQVSQSQAHCRCRAYICQRTISKGAAICLRYSHANCTFVRTPEPSEASKPSRSGVGRVDGVELDVEEDDLAVGYVRLDIWGLAGGGRGSAASDAGRARVTVSRVVAVALEHVRSVVVPNAQHEYHGFLIVSQRRNERQRRSTEP